MKFSVSMPDEVVAGVDRARGMISRSAWLADLARTALGQTSSDETPLARVTPVLDADPGPSPTGAASPQGASGPAASDGELSRTEQFRRATGNRR